MPERFEGPVFIEQVRICHFKAKPCKLCGLPKSNRVHTPEKYATCPFQRQNGCDRCGRNKGDVAHFGAPPSFNVFASGAGSGNAMVYAGAKRAWQDIFVAKLAATDLPRPVPGVFVEGEVTFPNASEDRDQGNFRVIIEKALGDALEAGGWLARDDWTRYEFGNLSMRVVPGQSATRLTIFPMDKQATMVLDGWEDSA